MSLRMLLKGSMFAAAVLLVWPFWILSWLERRLGLGEQMFALGAQLFSLLPGPPGRTLRAAYYVGTLEYCHWEVNVGFGSLFVKRAASMGRHASTGCYCVLGNAEIGERVMIGSRVSIPSGKRQHFDDTGRLTSGAGHFDRVKVGAGSWIGEGAIVMADVGRECVVAAGSVVGKETPDRFIVSGNPARAVRAVDVECES